MERNQGFENSLGCLQHPLSLISIALPLLNDHWIRSSLVCSSQNISSNQPPIYSIFFIAPRFTQILQIGLDRHLRIDCNVTGMASLEEI